VPVLQVDQLKHLDVWLRSILWDAKLPGIDSSPADYRKPEVHRLKARLTLSNGEVKIVQGVREIFEIQDAPASDRNKYAVVTPTAGKIVLIGRELLGCAFEESFKNTVII
jgi:hypothetical protein